MPHASEGEFYYRGRSRFVAWVDLILSCSCFIISIVMIVLVSLGIKDLPGIAVGGRNYPQDIIWKVRIAMEIICICLALKLLQSTNPSVAQATPEKASRWCTFWITNCVIWILLLASGIVLTIVQAIQNNKESFGEIMVFVGLIVVRMGAVVAVVDYKRELKWWISENSTPSV